MLTILNSCGGDEKQADWRSGLKTAPSKDERVFERLQKNLEHNISMTNELDAALMIYIDMEKVE